MPIVENRDISLEGRRPDAGLLRTPAGHEAKANRCSSPTARTGSGLGRRLLDQ